jgi:hypothetical protein
MDHSSLYYSLQASLNEFIISIMKMLSQWIQKNTAAMLMLTLMLFVIWLPESTNAQVSQPERPKQQQQQLNVSPTTTAAVVDTTSYSTSTTNNTSILITELSEEREDRSQQILSESIGYNLDNPPEDATPHGNNGENNTTTSMLVRLIPIKLVVVLLIMILVIAFRQIAISVDSRYAPYEGINPTDVDLSDHQKTVEFELLQLAASNGDDDNDDDDDNDEESSGQQTKAMTL